MDAVATLLAAFRSGRNEDHQQQKTDKDCGESGDYLWILSY